MDIKKIVNSLVKKHKTRNPFEIIKGLNVILVPVPLEGVQWLLIIHMQKKG